jgi:hypothetical protein
MLSVLINSIKTVFPKLAISQFIGWGISFIIDNHTFVDVAWGVNHLIFAGISCTNTFTDFSMLKNNPRNMVGMFLISLWFTRLSGFLFKERIFKRHVDPRYEEMSQKRKMNNNLHTFIQFQLQGFISLFTGFSINYLFTNDYDYLNNYTTFIPKNQEKERVDTRNIFIREIRNRIEAYFKLVVRNLRDSIPKSIGHFLVKSIQDTMQLKLYNQLYKSTEMVTCLNEPENIQRRREELHASIKTMKEAQKLIKRDPE